MAKNEYVFSASLIRVIDGDTLVLSLTKTFSFPVDFGFSIKDVVSLTKTTEQKFRLAGINSPEHGTPEGDAATAEMVRLLKLGTLVVTSHGPDKYGRWLGSIVVTPAIGASFDVSAQLVAGGFAKVWDGKGAKPV